VHRNPIPGDLQLATRVQPASAHALIGCQVVA